MKVVYARIFHLIMLEFFKNKFLSILKESI